MKARRKMAWLASPRVQHHPDGRTRLRLEFACEFELPRPSWWTRLPGFLEAAGFELDHDFDGSVEIFAPASFHSARAVISATLTFHAGEAEAMQAGVDRLLAELGFENALAPEARS
jgi:hypothetical protein